MDLGEVLYSLTISKRSEANGSNSAGFLDLEISESMQALVV